jgi:hypothetical protein
MSADASPLPPERLPGDPTPEQRRRNAVLGSLLLAFVIVLTGTWMIVFKRNGLPKDPQEAKRLEALQQAQRAQLQPEPAPVQTQPAQAATPAADSPAPAAERAAR